MKYRPLSRISDLSLNSAPRTIWLSIKSVTGDGIINKVGGRVTTTTAPDRMILREFDLLPRRKLAGRGRIDAHNLRVCTPASK